MFIFKIYNFIANKDEAKCTVLIKNYFAVIVLVQENQKHRVEFFN